MVGFLAVNRFFDVVCPVISGLNLLNGFFLPKLTLLDDLRHVILVLTGHVAVQKLFELSETACTFLGMLTKRLGEPSFLSLFLDHLKQVVDHLTFIFELSWDITGR